MQYQYHFGKKFYLDKKRGYWISTTSPRVRAHVWVWKQTIGQIPKGFHIHHKDENKSNNSIENLQMLFSYEHLSMHSKSEKNRQRASKWCDQIRPLTKEWHRSHEGREWHKKHGIDGWLKREEITKICQICSNEFKTKTYHQIFCSGVCKSRWRRKLGIDDIEISCNFCHTIFKRNKYAKSKFCSRRCSSDSKKNKIH